MTHLTTPEGRRIAYDLAGGTGPAVVFLGGFRSDMEGSKTLHLRDGCAARGRAFLRLDYSGHGISGGAFEDGTIGAWAEDAALVIEARVPGPMVLVGSSMGGWIALLLARRWGAGRVRGVIGIAAAPDFTEALMPGEFTEADRAALERDGVLRRPSEYGEPIPITRRLLEEGRNHLLLPGPIPPGIGGNGRAAGGLTHSHAGGPMRIAGAREGMRKGRGTGPDGRVTGRRSRPCETPSSTVHPRPMNRPPRGFPAGTRSARQSGCSR